MVVWRWSKFVPSLATTEMFASAWPVPLAVTLLTFVALIGLVTTVSSTVDFVDVEVGLARCCSPYRWRSRCKVIVPSFKLLRLMRADRPGSAR